MEAAGAVNSGQRWLGNAIEVDVHQLMVLEHQVLEPFLVDAAARALPSSERLAARDALARIHGRSLGTDVVPDGLPDEVASGLARLLRAR